MSAPSGQRSSSSGLTLLGAMAIVALCGPSFAEVPSEIDADARTLLAAVTQRDSATLDRLSEAGPPSTRALAAVARVHTLDDVAARRAAIEAGFVVRWNILEPIPGGPRGLDRVRPPLTDWIEARESGVYRGVLGPIRWRPAGASSRFGLVDLARLTADVPGHRMARATVRIADGGAAVAWVYSATPWRLWVDGQPAGGGWGEPGLRRGEPVVLNLGPGAHRLLLVVDGDGSAVALRFAAPNGVPMPVDALDGRPRPHGVSLGPLPGKPRLLPDPLLGFDSVDLPAEIGPRAGLSEATPDARRALVGDAPFRAPLWRRIALDDGAGAEQAWARVAELEPLDFEARRRARPHRWPTLDRVPDGARDAPPPGAHGPLWWAVSQHRIDVEPAQVLLEQHLVAVRILSTGGRPPWPPADADEASCTVLRSDWVLPLSCPRRGGHVVGLDLAPEDVVVIAWRRARRGAALVLDPPPSPFGRWSVQVEAAAEAPLRIDVPPDASVRRDGQRRVWRLDVTTAAEGSMAIGTWVDDDALAQSLDRRLPPARPVRVPDVGRRSAVIADALARSSRQTDPTRAARALIDALADAGEVGAPIFARPVGMEPPALRDANSWPVPLVAVGERILDPRHPSGARSAALQGAAALRIERGGVATALRLPVDPPEAHRLVVSGELRIDDGLLAVTLTRAGRSPFPDAHRRARAADVLEATDERLVVRRADASAFFALPGFGDESVPGPHRVTVDLRVSAPAGNRPPKDVALEGPSGRYRRTTTPIADGWRTVRDFEWRGAGEGARAFLAAVRSAEAEPLMRGGTP